MARKRKNAIVMGLDLAAVNSGICVISSKPTTKGGHVSYDLLFELGIAHGPLREPEARAKAADLIKGLCVLHAVDLVVIEDYINNFGRTNTSGYQAGETVGMVKKALLEIGVPFIVVPPSSMRSMLGVPKGQKDSGKQFIMDYAKDEHGFESAMTNQSKRSDATDAFIHSIIGSIVYFQMKGEKMGDYNDLESDVLFGNGKKMEGILNAPERFFYCDWANFNNKQDEEEQP